MRFQSNAAHRNHYSVPGIPIISFERFCSLCKEIGRCELFHGAGMPAINQIISRYSLAESVTLFYVFAKAFIPDILFTYSLFLAG